MDLELFLYNVGMNDKSYRLECSGIIWSGEIKWIIKNVLILKFSKRNYNERF